MLLTDDLIWEVLKRLPVKSLMRFKCVSRKWLSIITDPSFSRAYSGGSRGLLSVYQLELESHPIFYLSLNGGSCIPNQINLHHTVEHGDWDETKSCTDIVDGLLCFYRDRDSWLYNVATREMVQLPVATDFGKPDDTFDSYHFGFDTVNHQYKLLRTCSVCQEKYGKWHMNVEILTIGVDSSWRIIGSFANEDVELEGRSACFGGVLCWLNYIGDELIAFNLGQEKFIHITVPIDLAEANTYYYMNEGEKYLKLANFGPDIIITKPAKAREASRVQILRYRLSDSVNGGEIAGDWVDYLPEVQAIETEAVDGECEYEPRALGVIPNGKMLMYDICQRFPVTLHFFDPSERNWELIQIDASQELDIRKRDVFDNWSYFEENIISLVRLTTHN